MLKKLPLLIEPVRFFRMRVNEPTEITVPLCLVISAAGFASASMNLIAAGYWGQFPESMRVFLERLGFVETVFFIAVYTLMWPLIAGAIGLTAVSFWNAEVRFRKLVELVGYAYFPFVLAGVCSFALLWAMPVELVPADQFFEPAALTAALERSPSFSAARLIQSAGKVWCFLLTATAVSQLLRLRWLQGAVCVGCPYLLYTAFLALWGI